MNALNKSHVNRVAAACAALAIAIAAQAPVQAAQPASSSATAASQPRAARSGAVVLLSRIRVKPGAEAQFETAIRDLYAGMRLHEPGCIANIMYRPAGPPGSSEGAFGLTPPKPGLFVFYEVYADQQAAQAHTQPPHFKAFMARSADLIDGKIELEFLEEITRK